MQDGICLLLAMFSKCTLNVLYIIMCDSLHVLYIMLHLNFVFLGFCRCATLDPVLGVEGVSGS